jgi:hypothetical protein
MTSIPLKQLTDDELEELASFLDANAPLDFDGALGVMHAVAVAPGLLQTSTWIPLVSPVDGSTDTAVGVRCARIAIRARSTACVVWPKSAVGAGEGD